MSDHPAEAVEALARVVAEALWGEGAGDFNAATGYTITSESRRVAAAVLAAGYAPPPLGREKETA